MVTTAPPAGAFTQLQRFFPTLGQRMLSARLNVLLHVPAGWALGQPEPAPLRPSQGSTVLSSPGCSDPPVTRHPEGRLETRQRDEHSFYLLGLLVFLFCGFEFLWGFHVKRVLLSAEDGQEPRRALLAGCSGQQGASLVPALRGFSRMFVQG